MSQHEQSGPVKPIVSQQLSFSERTEDWYENNSRWLNILLGVVLVAVIGFQLYRWQTNRQRAKASAAYNSAFFKLNQAAAAEDTAKQDAYLGAVTAAQSATGDFPNTFLGRRAQLLAANSYYQLATEQSGMGVGKGKENLVKAREAFTKYIAVATTPEEKAAGHLGLGNVLEDLSFIENNIELLKEAISAYKQAETLGKDTHISGQAKLALGRVYSASTDKSSPQQAAQVLESLAKDQPVRLSSTTPENAPSIKLGDGNSLTPQQVADLRNFADWSYQQAAKDSLARIN